MLGAGYSQVQERLSDKREAGHGKVILRPNHPRGWGDSTLHKTPNRPRFRVEMKAFRQRTHQAARGCHFAHDFRNHHPPDALIIHAIVGNLIKPQKPGQLRIVDRISALEIVNHFVQTNPFRFKPVAQSLLESRSLRPTQSNCYARNHRDREPKSMMAAPSAAMPAMPAMPPVPVPATIVPAVVPMQPPRP